MRIIHCIFSFNVGGAETMLVDILNEQVLEHEVHLIVINKSYSNDLLKSLDKRVKCHLIGRVPGIRGIFSLIKLHLLIGLLKPRILHVHHTKLLDIFLPMQKTLKVITIHDVGIELFRLNRADLVIAISEAVKEDVESRSGFPCVLIPNGIRCKDVRVKSTSMHHPFRILQVGRLDNYKKGCDITIQAVAQLRKENVDISLAMIGEGSGEKDIRSWIASFNLEDCVRLLGKQSRSYIYEEMANYDLLIQPSRYEGFGLTVAEGLAAKLPVLVSNSGGPIEIIKQGRYGYFFQSEDVDACVQTIEHIISHYDEALERATLALEYVREEYGIQRLVSRYIQAYEQLLSAKNDAILK